MAVNEQIVSGRAFRKLIDKANMLWMRVSYWSKASDVEFDDGESAEEKVTNIENNINNMSSSGTIKYVKIVSSLPSDASAHTDTLYIIPG